MHGGVLGDDNNVFQRPVIQPRSESGWNSDHHLIRWHEFTWLDPTEIDESICWTKPVLFNICSGSAQQPDKVEALMQKL